MPDSDLLEHVCNESESDSAHLVGKASDLKNIAVEVAPEILEKYPGVYAGTDLSGFPVRIEIFLSGRECRSPLTAIPGEC